MPAYSKISIIIPTLNSGKVLEKCLQSIRQQKYPQKYIDILIIDANSVDNTEEIAQKYTCQIFKNPLKTAEAAKAIGIQKAQGDYIALIDSDNILPDPTWLSQMLMPFTKSSEIIGSEPIEFTYRPSGGFIERYSALFGVNDPYVYFLGNYDRRNHINFRWTNLKISTKKHRGYLVAELKAENTLPTIGANGTIYKSSFLQKNFSSQYFFDIDIISSFFKKNKQPLFFAKVYTGIIHTYCESSILKFIRKQQRRIKDNFTYQDIRTYQWQKTLSFQNILFVLYSIFIIPPLIDSIRGYFHQPDFAWFFHPLACIITSFIYVSNSLLKVIGLNQKQDRGKWQQ